MDEVSSQDPPSQTEFIEDENPDDVVAKPQIRPSEDFEKDDESDFPLNPLTVSISSIILSTICLSMPLYMKINRKDLLKNKKRKTIFKYISTNPGDNFNRIKQSLKLSNGVLTYHLKILERENFITSKNEGSYKRYYIPGESSLNNVKRLNGVQNEVFNIVKNFPGISQTAIAQKLGTTVQVVNYHIKRLHDDGLIKLKMTYGHRSQCFPETCESLSLT